MRVLVISIHCNRTDFIDYQYKTLQHFLKDEDYEYVIFNEGKDDIPNDIIMIGENTERKTYAELISDKCTELNIECVRVPQEIHSMPYLERTEVPTKGTGCYQVPSVRHCNAVMYALNNRGFDFDGYVFFIDSDAFLIADLNVNRYMEGKHFASVMSCASNGVTGIHYSWPIFTFIDMVNIEQKEIIDFNCGLVEDVMCDAGGNSHYICDYYRTNHPDKIAIISCTSSCAYCHEDDKYSCPEHCIRCKGVSLVDYERPELRSICEHHNFTEKVTEYLINDYNFCGSAGNIVGKNCWHYRAGSDWTHDGNKWHNDRSMILKEFIDSL